MKAVVLAGGPEASRCPLALVRPRPLFPLVSDVLLGKLLRTLHETDVSEAVVCANGKTRVMREHFLKRPSEVMPLEFYDDEMPRGAGGCVKDVEGFLGNEPFLVVEGGLFLDGDLKGLIEEHRASGSAMTVAAVPAREWSGGDGSGRDGERLSPLGVYVAEPEVLAHIPEHGFYDMKEQLIPKLKSRGLRVSASRYHGQHRRIGCANTYAAFVQELLSGVLGMAVFAGLQETASQVWQAEGAQVAPTARLIGPVVVGPNAVVGAEAVVTGPTLIGEGVVVGERAFVSASILWPNCVVGFGARVEGSIVTDSFRVGDSTRLSHSVAVDKTLRQGDVHGLGMSGYSVHSYETVTELVRKQASFMTALHKMRRSLFAMRHGQAADRRPERPLHTEHLPR